MQKTIFTTTLILCLFGCRGQAQKDYDPKKLLFGKILDYIKKGDMDSVKNYVYFDDTNYLNYNVKNIDKLIKNTNPYLDSIKLSDSFNVGNVWNYHYRLNVYEDTLIGYVDMKFSNDTIVSSLMGVDFRPLHIDTSLFKNGYNK